MNEKKYKIYVCWVRNVRVLGLSSSDPNNQINKWAFTNKSYGSIQSLLNFIRLSKTLVFRLSR